MAKAEKLPGMTGPGVGSEKIEELEDAAAEYVRVRDARCAITPDEVEKKDRLIALMHEHEAELGRDGNGIMRYEMEDGRVVRLRPGKEKLTVKDADEEVDEGEE